MRENCIYSRLHTQIQCADKINIPTDFSLIISEGFQQHFPSTLQKALGSMFANTNSCYISLGCALSKPQMLNQACATASQQQMRSLPPSTEDETLHHHSTCFLSHQVFASG